jgi:DUF2975 family protein
VTLVSKSLSSSTALPFAHLVLRVLIVVNWAAGIPIFVLLVAMPTSQWIRTALKVPADDPVIIGLQAIAALGLVAIPLNAVVLKRLLAIVASVREGDPFVAANAARLQTIAWMLLALQILSVIIGAIGRMISTPAHPFKISAGFSISGWLAVLLIFLLARVFAAGTVMRDELEGTV